MKQALGLAVSGTEVRLAHLVFNKGRLHIEALERARLKTTLEFQRTDDDKLPNYAEADGKDAFGMKESAAEAQNGQRAEMNSANLETLYGLLERFTRKKIKAGFNVPLSMVNYLRPNNPFAGTQTAIDRVSATDKDAGPNWGHQPLRSKDGVSMVISYERQPPTLSLLRDLKGYLRGHLRLALMDTSEMALASLARSSMKLEANRVTAIIYIEDDFTRLIFLRGEELFHVSSIIHERATSPDILEVIYRKLIYEQDEVNMPIISAILLAGKGYRIDAREFFAERFEGAVINYLASDRFGRFPSNERERETFSEFAVPIALAWKLLQPQNPFCHPLNLLPQEVRDQQEVLKMSYHGYALLAITGLVAFLLTWQILKVRSDISSTRVKNTQLELKIKDNQSTVDQVLDLDNQSQRFSKNLMLPDSLSRGHDEFLLFLQKLNASVRRAGSLWVDEILKQKDGFSISGTSMNRETIPVLAEKLGGANLRKVTRAEASSRKMFQFELEHRNDGEAQFSERDVRIIDVNNASGNLILTKEGNRRPATSTNGTSATAAGNKLPIRPQNAPALGKNNVEAGRDQASSALRAEIKPAPAVPQSKTGGAPATRQNNLEASQPSNAAGAQAANRFAANEPSPRVDGDRSAATGPLTNGAAPRETRPTGVRPSENDGRDLRLPRSPDRLKIESKGEAEATNRIAMTSLERQAPVERPNIVPSAPQNAAPAPAKNPAVPGSEERTAPSTAPIKPSISNKDRYRAYSIEAAVSYTKNHAEQVAAVFRKKGLDTLVQDFEDDSRGAKRYRVLVGMFATQSAAETKAAQLAGLLMKDYRIVGL